MFSTTTLQPPPPPAIFSHQLLSSTPSQLNTTENGNKIGNEKDLQDKNTVVTVKGASKPALAWNQVETIARTHTYHSAFLDATDNSREARGNIDISAHKFTPDSPIISVVISDNGQGYANRRHVEDGMSFGISPVKGNKHNHGQGEKSAGLHLANCMVKLAQITENIRVVGMFSRTMQLDPTFQAIHKTDTIRPLVEFRADPSEPVGQKTWRMFDSEKEDLDLILKWSPFKKIAGLMGGFEELLGKNVGRSFRTHLILSELREGITINEKEGDINFNDSSDMKKKWQCYSSLKSALSITYPRLSPGDLRTDSGIPLGFSIKMFGREIEQVSERQ